MNAIVCALVCMHYMPCVHCLSAISCWWGGGLVVSCVGKTPTPPGSSAFSWPHLQACYPQVCFWQSDGISQCPVHSEQTCPMAMGKGCELGGTRIPAESWHTHNDFIFTHPSFRPPAPEEEGRFREGKASSQQLLGILGSFPTAPGILGAIPRAANALITSSRFRDDIRTDLGGLGMKR